MKESFRIIEPEDIPEDKSEPKPKDNIIEVDYGIAFRTGNGKIYINKNLKDYNPELYDKIIGHEKSHHDGDYDDHDLEIDLNDKFMSLKDKIDFCSKYPKGLLAFSPVIITKDEIAVSWLGIFQIAIFLCLIAFIVGWVF